MTCKINLTNKVQRKENNLVSDMGDEKVMLSISNGKYYNLGVIGGVIWENVSESIVVSELISNLKDQFDVDQEVCEEETLTFLTSLLNENLIEVS